MSSSNRLSQLKSEGHQLELPPLTEYLNRLVRDYPKGVGIIKELLQNADDAGATDIHFVIDRRDFTDGQLPSIEMRDLMGPALLVFNNGQFSDSDLEGIRRLSRGSKSDDPSKTGRFGLGFNSVYNVTEVPQLLTRDWLFFFDPHAKTVPEATRNEPVRSFRVADLWKHAPTLLEPFDVVGLAPNVTHFEATAFRFSFRTDKQALLSEISKDPFTDHDIAQIIRALDEVGSSFLLFLRSVLRIQISEIAHNGSALKQIGLFETMNPVEVSKKRQYIHNRIRQPDILAVLRQCARVEASFKHEVRVAIGDRRHEETWRVVTGLYTDTEGRLVDAARALGVDGEKASPQAASAALIESSSSVEVEGHLFCFLPFPGKTGFPVHLHAFFDPDSSRQAPTYGDDLQGKDERRARWNALLVEHAVAVSYHSLLRELRTDIGEESPLEFYRYLPRARATYDLLEELPGYIFESAADEPLIATASRERWQPIQRAIVLPSGSEDVRAPVKLMHLPLADPPLPDDLMETLVELGFEPHELTGQVLRDRLAVEEDLNCEVHAAPHPWLRDRKWIASLLRFCLRGPQRGSVARLKGLPLALTATGRLRTFGLATDTLGEPRHFFLALDEEIDLFRSQADFVLDPAFARQTGVASSPNGETVEVSVDVFINNLPWLLGAEDRSDKLLFDPKGTAIPNEVWLEAVFQYLAENADELNDLVDELTEIPLLPDQSGHLRHMGYEDSPLLRPHSKQLQDALERIQVPLVTASSGLDKAIRRLEAASEGLGIILKPSAQLLTEYLGAAQDLARRDGDALDAILTYLAGEERRREIASSAELIEKLRAQPLYPTTDGGRVPITNRVFFAAGIDTPPQASGRVRFIDLRSQEWRELLFALGVESLNQLQVLRVLLDEYMDLDSTDRHAALSWIRDNYSRLEADATGGSDGRTDEVFHLISHASLVRCSDGEYRSIAEVYDPAAELPRRILGDRAFVPDMEHYPGSGSRWRRFFMAFGMAEVPRTHDILAYLNALIARATLDGVDAVRKDLGDLWNHFAKHLEKPKSDDDEELVEALASTAWLPALCAPPSDVPGFQAPENRLYRPNEIYPATQRLVIASQLPTLPFADSADLRTLIDMPRDPPLDAVLKHFDVLLRQWALENNGGIRPGPFGSALAAVYRYLGNYSGDLAHLAEDYDDVPCLWSKLELRLCRPRHVFSSSVPFFGRWRAQLTDGEQQVNAGYDVLGRRDTPEIEDLFEFLFDLHDEYGGEALRLEDQECFHRVLLQVQERQRNTRPTPADLPLLSDEERLVPASNLYLSDARWFAERIPSGEINILHKKIDSALALEAGVRRLSECIDESLAQTPIRLQDEQTNLLCSRLEKTLRSEEFAAGLLRLIENEGRSEHPGNLRWLSRISVLPTSEILTTLYLTPEERVVGEGEAEFFFDDKKTLVYLTAPVMAKLLADAVNQNLDGGGLKDTSTLTEIVQREPHDIDAVLTRCRIPKSEQEEYVDEDFGTEAIEVTRTEEHEASERPEHYASGSVGEVPSGSVATELPIGDSSADQRDRRADGVVDRQDLDVVASENGSHPGRIRDEPGPRIASGVTFGSSPRGRGEDGGIGVPGSSGETHAPQPDKQPGAAGLRPARSSGSSSPQRRLKTFIYVTGEEGDPQRGTDDGDHPEAIEIGNAGLQRVLLFEAESGREAEPQEHTNPGFDVISRDLENVRYIEVKSVKGPWGDRGVQLSHRQFQEALLRRDQFWLYIVENVFDDEKAQIWPINDPVTKITSYAFDDGWKYLADAKLQRPEVGLMLVTEDGELAKILDVTTMGHFHKLRVEYHGGAVGDTIFKPHLMRLVDLEV